MKSLVELKVPLSPRGVEVELPRSLKTSQVIERALATEPSGIEERRALAALRRELEAQPCAFFAVDAAGKLRQVRAHDSLAEIPLSGQKIHIVVQGYTPLGI